MQLQCKLTEINHHVHLSHAHLANQYWLTGSQQFHLMKGVSESLAGRVGIYRLLGLSKPELEGRGLTAVPFLPTSENILANVANEKWTLPTLYQAIWKGSFPGLSTYWSPGIPM